MADNYLEKRYDEVFGSGAGRRPVVKRVGQSLESLLLRCRSHRSYDRSVVVSEAQLRRIIAVGARIPSARNQQVLRYRPVTGAAADALTPLLHFGGALPQLQLPPQGMEPTAYIVVCTAAAEDRYVLIDLGISVEAMLLQATEMGLNGLCLCAFSPTAVAQALALPPAHTPLAVIAIGKGADRVHLEPIAAADSHAYYRTPDGIHHVPKLTLDDLIV